MLSVLIDSLSCKKRLVSAIYKLGLIQGIKINLLILTVVFYNKIPGHVQKLSFTTFTVVFKHKLCTTDYETVFVFLFK